MARAAAAASRSAHDNVMTYVSSRAVYSCGLRGFIVRAHPQVCHGLRNPLHASMGLLDLARGGEGTPPSGCVGRGGGGGGGGGDGGGDGGSQRFETLHGSLRAELRKMQGVLNAVVEAQQLEAGQAPVTLEPTDLQAIVRDVCQYHRNALRPGVELTVSVAPNVSAIVSDGVRIGQVRATSRCGAELALCASSQYMAASVRVRGCVLSRE